MSQPLLQEIRQLFNDQSNTAAINVRSKGVLICQIFSYEVLDASEELGKILKQRKIKGFKQTINEETKSSGQRWEGSFKVDFDSVQDFLKHFGKF